MTAEIEVKGNKPGELIAESVNYINRLIRRKYYPLWKKTQEPATTKEPTLRLLPPTNS